MSYGKRRIGLYELYMQSTLRQRSQSSGRLSTWLDGFGIDAHDSSELDRWPVLFRDGSLKEHVRQNYPSRGTGREGFQVGITLIAHIPVGP